MYLQKEDCLKTVTLKAADIGGLRIYFMIKLGSFHSLLLAQFMIKTINWSWHCACTLMFTKVILSCLVIPYFSIYWILQYCRNTLIYYTNTNLKAVKCVSKKMKLLAQLQIWQWRKVMVYLSCLMLIFVGIP